MVLSRKFVLISKFDGEPKPSDFEIKTEELRAYNHGKDQFQFCITLHWSIFQWHNFTTDVLLEIVYWSVDPYVRLEMQGKKPNSTVVGENIAK